MRLAGDASALDHQLPASVEKTTPKRYVGRSGKRLPAVNPDQPLPADTDARNATPLVVLSPLGMLERMTHPISIHWSLRLVIAVSLVCGALVALRMPGLLTPPVDTQSGVEATHAAFVSTILGTASQPGAAVHMVPPPAPWQGPAPANPIASLPVYDWIVAALMAVLGPEALLGRIVSIIFSLLAGLFFFAIIRRTAGARAALYSLLFYSVAPLSVALGQHFSPSSLIICAQAGTILALVRWRSAVGPDKRQSAGAGQRLAFGTALLASALLSLVDPGALFMIAPAVYIVIMPEGSGNPFSRGTGALASWSAAWRQSADRGKAVAIVCALTGPSLLWWAYSQSAAAALTSGGSSGGVAERALALLAGGTYVQIIGLVVERLLTVAGLLLFGIGLLHAARPPFQMVFHAWLAGALFHTILDASRLPGSEDVLLPLILPACALAGIGAAWAGALPARLWLAVKEQKRDQEADYSTSPHTAWLLSLPEERIRDERRSRPQAQLALSRSVAQRTQAEQLRLRRAWLLASGHVLVVVALLLIVAGSLPSLLARLQPSEQDVRVAGIGSAVAGLVPPGARLIVAGPFAPELFYSSRHTGWALSSQDFDMSRVEALQAQGAVFLLSADQDWLGRHPDYRGLITSYSVLKLTQDFIVFDLNTKPADSDRLYFLESGHTLGGAFRRFWESHGGVVKLGYPISEEILQTNPVDGQVRTVQYFERAVLEYHQENAGKPDEVMLASVGLWVTNGRDFPRVEPFRNSADVWYFPQTGHSVKQAFLKYWQKQGGLASFGYPISEELPEINPVDGKVYTVQYFERARFEWHPTFAGTPDEVQLGLIGKQALAMFHK